MRVQVPPSASGSPDPSGEPFVVLAPPGWCVYVLRLCDGHFYTGMTEPFPERLVSQASGRGPTTVRMRLPFELVWYEPFANAATTRRVEKWLKRRSVAEKKAYMAAHGIVVGHLDPESAGEGE